MPPQQPIYILGAGIAGLSLAQCLRHRNIPSVVFERLSHDANRPAYGITLHKRVYRPLLAALGMTENDFFQRVALEAPDRGGTVHDRDTLRVNRMALERELRRGLDIRWASKLKHLRDLNDGVGTMEFDHSLRAPFLSQPYRFLVAADGVHSTARSRLQVSDPSAELKVLPYIVFNGRRRLQSFDVPPSLLQAFERPSGISHTQGDVHLTITADSYNPYTRKTGVSYTLSRPARPGDEFLLDRDVSDARAKAACFKHEIEALAPLPPPFASLFSIGKASDDRWLHWLMRSLAVDRAVLARAAREKGVLLIGDAAHAQPVPGNGANLAIEDALELAARIGDDGEVDVEGFLEAREEAWLEGRRVAEEYLREVHCADGDETAKL